MTITKETLDGMSAKKIRKILDKHDVPYPANADHDELARIAYKHYCDLKKYIDYSFLKQLGVEGKDGNTFLAQQISTGDLVAIKIFKSDKPSSEIEIEALMQQTAAAAGISPKVIEYHGDAKYIAMERMDTNLFDYLKKQNGVLTTEQEKAIIKLFKKLDKCGIFHADPNPLNFMKKGGKWFIIDFGFAKPITDEIRREYGSRPNLKMMPLGFKLRMIDIFGSCDCPYIDKYIDESLLRRQFSI